MDKVPPAPPITHNNPPPPAPGARNRGEITPATQALMQLPSNFQAADPTVTQRLKNKSIEVFTALKPYSLYVAVPAGALLLVGVGALAIWLTTTPAFKQLVSICKELVGYTLCISLPGVALALMK